MARELHRVKIAPKGMGLNDFVAMQEGFFAAEGLDVELDWKTFRGTQSSWKDLQYFQRPQAREPGIHNHSPCRFCVDCEHGFRVRCHPSRLLPTRHSSADLG
jgi:hypothetical protein